MFLTLTEEEMKTWEPAFESIPIDNAEVKGFFVLEVMHSKEILLEKQK